MPGTPRCAQPCDPTLPHALRCLRPRLALWQLCGALSIICFQLLRQATPLRRSHSAKVCYHFLPLLQQLRAHKQINTQPASEPEMWQAAVAEGNRQIGNLQRDSAWLDSEHTSWPSTRRRHSSLCKTCSLAGLLLAQTHPPVCLLLSLSLCVSLSLFISPLLSLLLSFSICLTLSLVLLLPLLALCRNLNCRNIWFLLLCCCTQGVWEGIRGMVPCPLPASAGTAVANFTPNIILLSW